MFAFGVGKPSIPATERFRGFENPLPQTLEAAEEVAVANRKRPSAAEAGPVFNQLGTG